MHFFNNFQMQLNTIAQAKLAEHVVIPFAIINYLDDFLFITLLLTICNTVVRQFMVICGKIGCPISLEKTEFGTEMIVFLGVLLDGKNKILAIPQEKRIAAINLLRYAINQRKVTIKFVQKLTGTLNFLNNCSWSDIYMRNV